MPGGGVDAEPAELAVHGLFGCGQGGTRTDLGEVDASERPEEEIEEPDAAFGRAGDGRRIDHDCARHQRGFEQTQQHHCARAHRVAQQGGFRILAQD